MPNSSIWPIDRTLSGATTLGQDGPGSDGNEEILCIIQRSSITGASRFDGLVSYPGHSSYTSAEMHLVYFTTPANWAKYHCTNNLITSSSHAKNQFIITQVSFRIYDTQKYKYIDQYFLNFCLGSTLEAQIS